MVLVNIFYCYLPAVHRIFLNLSAEESSVGVWKTQTGTHPVLSHTVMDTVCFLLALSCVISAEPAVPTAPWGACGAVWPVGTGQGLPFCPPACISVPSWGTQPPHLDKHTPRHAVVSVASLEVTTVCRTSASVDLPSQDPEGRREA